MKLLISLKIYVSVIFPYIIKVMSFFLAPSNTTMPTEIGSNTTSLSIIWTAAVGADYYTAQAILYVFSISLSW